MKKHDQGDATKVTGVAAPEAGNEMPLFVPEVFLDTKQKPRNLLALEGSLTDQGVRMLLMSTIRRI